MVAHTLQLYKVIICQGRDSVTRVFYFTAPKWPKTHECSFNQLNRFILAAVYKISSRSATGVKSVVSECVDRRRVRLWCHRVALSPTLPGGAVVSNVEGLRDSVSKVAQTGIFLQPWLR